MCDFLCSPSDMNECEDNLHHCTELCINLPGPYICSCPDGFILEEDGTSCSGIMIVILFVYLRSQYAHVHNHCTGISLYRHK